MFPFQVGQQIAVLKPAIQLIDGRMHNRLYHESILFHFQVELIARLQAKLLSH